jgi:hypothetical protein
MKWLIRRIRKGKGAIQYEDEIHFGDVLDIGRSANQAIFLNDIRAALEHATVTAVRAGRYQVQSLIAAGVRVNGNIQQQATIGHGSTIEIGTTRITIIEPPEGFEAAVEVTQIDKDEIKAREEAAKLPTALSETWLSRRRPAWIFFAIAIAFGLALPVAAHYLGKANKLPGRGFWETGELAQAHHYFGSDCRACHDQAFVSAKDDKCLSCHAATKAHADPAKFPMFELAKADCAYCHRDHNGPQGLIIHDQETCSDCHTNLSERSKVAQVGDIGDFGTKHTQFFVNLPAWDESGQFKPVRTSMDKQPLTELSGLKFPHDKHLGVVGGLQSPTGKRELNCASCHQPEAGGAAMKPVDFETMCMDCHRLSFDRNLPDRQMPHAQVSEILYRLNEFYARAAMDGSYRDQTVLPPNLQRRRPGQEISTEQRAEIVAWANRMTRQKTDAMFMGNCQMCHTVKIDAAADLTNMYQVAPVRVAGIWYAKSEFTHARHATMTCESCHAARESKTSADVLIPEISNCRACHAGEGTKGMLESACTTCHGFHQAPYPLKVLTPVATAPAQ